MIVVDTSVWIDFLNGTDSPERRKLHSLIEKEADIAITEIILTEILQGVRDDEDVERVGSYLLAFPVIKPKGTLTYLLAAELYRTCRKKGKTVRKTVDCIISAICIEHGLSLFHRDRDFEHIAACSKLDVLSIS